eukprot:scpid49621/ scgid33600/ 
MHRRQNYKARCPIIFLVFNACRTQAEGWTFAQGTGGQPITWVRQTSARVSSASVSERTLRRRRAELERAREAVCGGKEGSFAQQVHETHTLPSAERDSLLKSAGVFPPSSTESGVGLAIKADLNLPWAGLRKLQRWLKLFRVPIESEGSMRKRLDEDLPFDILAEELPLQARSGEVVMSPVVRFDSLVRVVLHYLDMYESVGQLTWRDGAIPDDEVWVKVGGDHGGKSFKMMFQIANLDHPNSLHNTIPFLVFTGKDLNSNLETTFNLFENQFQELGATVWKDKKTRLVLFGDYEFLSLSYGLSGPAGEHSCIYCRASKADMQLPHAPFAERSLHSMNECYKLQRQSTSTIASAHPSFASSHKMSVFLCYTSTLASSHGSSRA